ncbi:unnamed protein product, partial [marine sediment metagenome]
MTIVNTDANGYINVYLVAHEFYLVIITKTDYVEKTSNYIPAPPNEWGQTEEKIFKIEREAAEDEDIEDITMDSLVLSPTDNVTMNIYYLNLGNNNSYVNFYVYDFIGEVALTSYNISTYPNNISIDCDFSA